MSTQECDVTTINKLAQRIERDIRQRGLSSGDRYLTGNEVGLLLGVSTATANRAMTLLAEQKLLVRRRSSGTFVGSRMDNNSSSRVRLVYVLMPEYISSDSPPPELMIQGIRSAIPGANVLFGFLPETDRLAFVKDLLRDAIHRGQLSGVVPISCGREVYEYLNESMVPTVVMGSLFTPMERLASIDIDERQMARLLVGHLFERGHRRIAIIDNSRGCPGDNNFSDGVSEATFEACQPPNAVFRRFLPDALSIFTEIRKMLASDQTPTGFVARSLRLANSVEQALKSFGAPLDKFEIVFQHYHTAATAHSRFTHAQPRDDFAAIAERIGKTLRRLSEDSEFKPEHIIVPVELCDGQK